MLELRPVVARDGHGRPPTLVSMPTPISIWWVTTSGKSRRRPSGKPFGLLGHYRRNSMNIASFNTNDRVKYTIVGAPLDVTECSRNCWCKNFVLGSNLGVYIIVGYSHSGHHKLVLLFILGITIGISTSTSSHSLRNAENLGACWVELYSILERLCAICA